MKAYVVGGAVRDWLMGRLSKDTDYVVVDATHQQMIDAGYKKVGADFPVYLHPLSGCEYALARKERKTGDGYLGFETTTDGVTLEEDLSRRDLTINAMARPTGIFFDFDIVDPFGGRRDLKDKVLRHVSPAFAEDPLRVVRLARLYARYSDFTIADETMVLAREMVRRGDLNHLPSERFWAELHKVFEEDRPDRFFDLLYALGADTRVTFFKEVYGMLSTLRHVAQKKVALQVLTLPADQRVMHHVALCRTLVCGGGTTFYPDARTRDLASNLRAAWGVRRHHVDAIYDLLLRSRAFSEGPQLGDLLTAMRISEEVRVPFPMSMADLQDAADAAKEVRAANYLSIFEPGRALGEHVERERKKVIEAALLTCKSPPPATSAV